MIKTTLGFRSAHPKKPRQNDKSRSEGITLMKDRSRYERNQDNIATNMDMIRHPASYVRYPKNKVSREIGRCPFIKLASLSIDTG